MATLKDENAQLEARVRELESRLAEYESNVPVAPGSVLKKTLRDAQIIDTAVNG